MKSVRIRSFFGPYFPSFWLNTERYGVSLRIQSECRKMRTRKTPNTDTFQAVFFEVNKKSFFARREPDFKASNWNKSFLGKIIVCILPSQSFRFLKDFPETRIRESLYFRTLWRSLLKFFKEMGKWILL